MELTRVSQMIREYRVELFETPNLYDATIFKLNLKLNLKHLVRARSPVFPQGQGQGPQEQPGLQIPHYEGQGTRWPTAWQKYWLAQYHSSIFILKSSLLAEARKLKTTLQVGFQESDKLKRLQFEVRGAGLWWRWPGSGASSSAVASWACRRPDSAASAPMETGCFPVRRRELGLGSGSCAWETSA